MLDMFAVGFQQVMGLDSLLIIFFGVWLGIIFGAIPGITASMGMAFLLPFTFSLDPTLGIVLLIALYIGGSSGGLITAILINIPGTPSSVATTFDGYPMAERGEAGRALGIGIITSFFGGMLSLLVLFFAAPLISSFAINFGPIEYFAVSLFSLTLIAGLSGESLLRGIAGCVIGMMLASIGQAPLDATSRFTLGISELDGGFQLLCALTGIYAVTEILKYVEEGKDTDNSVLKNYKIKGMGVKLSEFKGQVINVLRSSFIGIGIGILPGIGGNVSSLLAYSAAKNSSKYPEKFGTGVKDGLIASETSNNSVTGGALIPLLTLGIPGDGGTAILLAGFVIHGITPGPLLLNTHANLIYGMYAALIIANVMVVLQQFFGMRIFLKISQVPSYYLLPVVFALCVVGAFGVNSRVFDVWSILVFGIIGYVLLKFRFSLTPLIMGFILGPYVEINLLRGLMFSRGNFMVFLQRPISLLFLGFTVLYIAFVIRGIIKSRNKNKALLQNV